ncbi:MAG: polysaccharide deacetylase family protein [Acidimicrobiia bacterium]|nr:polysaccharide deacetylase family protein [Acidimicrobiia bacterium]
MSDRLRLVTKHAARLVDRLRPPSTGLVILAYHRVGRASTLEVDLPVTTFDQQMARLAQAGCVLDLGDALTRLAAGEDLSGKVVVTFDDGTADFAEHAVPVLECYQVPVTLYVATEYIDKQRSFPDAGKPLTWASLQDCVSTGLVTVGSHTHTHALLDRIDARAAAVELDRSIQLLGDRLGRSVEHFAYPKAVPASRRVEPLVRMRFRSAALAGTRPNSTGVDPHRLSRSPVQFSDGLDFFERKVSGGMALEDDLRRLLNRRRYAGLAR